ncbi:MAG: hypothetical protein QX199_15315 [Methylococcaceae bacterium]
MNNELLEQNNNTMTIKSDSDRIAAFRQKTVKAIEIWQPVPGESLVGILAGHQKASGVYGENYQILVQDESGAVTAAWLTQWLKENLKAQGSEVGDLVALTFLGKKTSPAGRGYNAYSLIVEKA